MKNIHAGNRERYEKTVKPKFEKSENGALETDSRRDLMVKDPYYNVRSLLRPAKK